MARLFLICSFILSVLMGRSADFHRTIVWYAGTDSDDLSGNSIPKFEGYNTVDQIGMPYWFESFEVKSSEVNVKISDAVFEIVKNQFPSFNLVIDSILHYKSEIGTSAGTTFLKLRIFPFIRKNNQINRLVSFTISTEENPSSLKAAKASWQWKANSVLSSGNWVKIKTKNKGIYKITYDQLKTWGFSNPEKVAIYGNGGLMLPVKNSDLKFDDVNAYPFWKGKDNSGKDCIFFYSTGNLKFSQDNVTGLITHQQNLYSAETYFFLTDQGIQKNIETGSQISELADKTVTSFPNYAFSEKESLNLLASGSKWFGERFIVGGVQTINFTLDNPDVSIAGNMRISVAGKSSSSNSMDVAVNGKSFTKINFSSIVNDPTSNFADEETATYSDVLIAKNMSAKLTYNAVNSSSEAWLDFIAINYQSFLNMTTDSYSFRGKGSDSQTTISEFALSSATATTKIFDVTDLQNTTDIPVTFADGKLKFKSNSTTYHEYIAFKPEGIIPSPELVGTVENQDLHGAELSEMIIVSSPGLLTEANRLANYHRTNDLMSVQVVTPEVIFNEFSGGLPDAAGIRNYFRMCYDRDQSAGGNKFKYVLLMGDGTFDNRNILGKNLNLIPTYQSDNSLSPVESFVTDDFFAFLGENEGGSSGIIDLGIGRIPANTLNDAETVVDKVMNYRQQQAMGNWRDVVTFIGDDEDYNTHMGQAESLANFVNQTYPQFYSDKIYLDAYKQISTPSGERYPDVTSAINNRVKQGTLIMNYTGHANEKNLADENVLDIGGINAWTNYNRLPLFVTATCEFSRFDGNETSAGERILFNPRGGGVGLFSTTRLVYSGANAKLNSQFFKYIFENDKQGNQLTLGDVMRLAKATSFTGTNQLNFSLLADPAMKLANPNNVVKTSSVNGKDVGIEVDTIRTLSVVTVKGYIEDSKGAKLTSFNGEIIPTVYDKAMVVETLGNAGQSPMSYRVQNNIIYKGLANVKNGEFEFSFFVPKDISYKLDKGKILYYAYNETIDAQGYFDDFYIGGSSNNAISDSDGPVIDLFMNSDSFRDGGQVSASSVLLANISDQTGINTAGTGIGHDITAVLDNDYSTIMILNDFFQSDKDSYTSGKIVFPQAGLSEGEHVLKIKVWDVLNNSTEKEIRFVVKDDFRIESVSCYPNPMQGDVRFVFTHNQPDETFDVNLEVFQINGTRVDNVEETVGSQGTESIPIEWTASERKVGMKPGVYIYRLTATTKDGKMTTGSGRMVYTYR